MFKECKCRIYIDEFKKIFFVSSMYWENGHLAAIGYEDPIRKGIVKIRQLSEKDILMIFIGKYDKNNNPKLYINKNNKEYEVQKEDETDNYYIIGSNNSKEYLELNSVPLIAKVTMKKNTLLTTELLSKGDNT